MITNRFHTVEFHISASAALDLIAGSIVVRNGMQNTWADERNQVVNDFKKFLPDLVGLDDKTGEMIDKLCPSTYDDSVAFSCGGELCCCAAYHVPLYEGSIEF